MRVEESITIDRPRDEVFAYLADRHHDTEWMGSVVESEWLDPAASVALGTRGRMTLKVFGRRTEQIDEVSEFVPGERIAHRTVQGTFLLNTACLTNTEGTGTRTSVVGETQFVPTGVFGRLRDRIVAGVMRRGFKGDLRRLKAILEQQATVLVAGGGAETRGSRRQ